MTTTPYQRLAIARARAGYASASEAARANKWNENTYRSHENGERGIRPPIATVYARAFKVSPAFILVDENLDQEVSLSSMFLNGHINPDWSIEQFKKGHLLHRPKQAIFITAKFFRAKPFAFSVKEDDQFGYMSAGDLLLIDENEIDFQRSVNSLCFIALEDGRELINFIKPGPEPSTTYVRSLSRRVEEIVKPVRIRRALSLFFRGQWSTLSVEAWRPEEGDDTT